MKSPLSNMTKKAKTREDFASLKGCASWCNDAIQWSRGDSNTRADHGMTKENTAFREMSKLRAAKCAAISAQPLVLQRITRRVGHFQGPIHED
jgi:hypothetical protein